MSDFALISQAIPQVFTVYNMLLIFGGLILGMVIGCVPGLSVTLGIILMLPLTYTFDDPASAIILLLAVYVGGMYGGSISAITLNTPGTNSAIATTFDGYPLAKKGKVKKALDTSLFASVFGGLFSAVLLLLCASLITKLVANFTSVEYFSLGIMGISLIAGVSGSSLPKSLISGMIGLLMACIGMDAVTGVTRFSFGSATLKYGIDMLPAMIALIALTQVVQKLRDFKVAGGKLDDARKIDKQGITKKEMVSILPACLRSSAIASVLGAMPGVGGGTNGDLYIFVTVREHKLYSRQGADLFVQIPVSMACAALGGSVEIPGIDGHKIEVKVAAGTQSGQRLKIKGEGMPKIRSVDKGDLWVEFKVETPVNLSPRQKELLEEFRSISGDDGCQPAEKSFFEKIKDLFAA